LSGKASPAEGGREEPKEKKGWFGMLRPDKDRS
jgi:hypothetical protein